MGVPCAPDLSDICRCAGARVALSAGGADDADISLSQETGDVIGRGGFDPGNYGTVAFAVGEITVVGEIVAFAMGDDHGR